MKIEHNDFGFVPLTFAECTCNLQRFIVLCTSALCRKRQKISEVLNMELLVKKFSNGKYENEGGTLCRADLGRNRQTDG